MVDIEGVTRSSERNEEMRVISMQTKFNRNVRDESAELSGIKNEEKRT